jgi:hypothetical protein
MQAASGELQRAIVIEQFAAQRRRVMSCGSDDFQLRRWLVSFASSHGWYAVGEYVALDAQAASHRTFWRCCRLLSRGNPVGRGTSAEAETASSR